MNSTPLLVRDIEPTAGSQYLTGIFGALTPGMGRRNVPVKRMSIVREFEQYRIARVRLVKIAYRRPRPTPPADQAERRATHAFTQSTGARARARAVRGHARGLVVRHRAGGHAREH